MGDGHIEQDLLILEKKVAKKLRNRRKKGCLAIAKHQRKLKGTPFFCCAECPGTSGKIEEDGTMKCSNTDTGVPVSVTAEQAGRCDGSKPPPPLEVKYHHKPNPIFQSHGYNRS
jgi:hypothetical protein